MEVTKGDLQKRLLRYFDGDKERVKRLATGCRAVGFDIGTNIKAIQEHPEQFMTLISFSDLGFLDKLTETLEVLKGK